MFERMVDRAFSHSPAEPAREQKDERVVTKMAVPGKAVAPFSPRTLPRDVAR
jgi:hypothetical protein